MEKMNELPIGTKIELPFVTLEVCESNKCNKCWLQDLCDEELTFAYKLVGTCLSDERSDKKDVYFKVIERK